MAAYQTLAEVNSDVRYNAGKDSNTLLDADLLRLANKYFFLMFRELVDLNEDIYTEISSADLSADQREYILPTDSASTPFGGGLVKLQRVEVSYDGTNWYAANPISLHQIPTPTILDKDINDVFSKSNPKYYFKDRSVWLAPIPDSNDDVAASNANLRIFWVERPGEMTATTDIPDIPKDFLSVLSEGMLIDVFRKYGKNTEMRIAESRWEKGLAKMRQLEQNIDVEHPYIFMSSKKNYS